jgi:hypothetical protein
MVKTRTAATQNAMRVTRPEDVTGAASRRRTSALLR